MLKIFFKYAKEHPNLGMTPTEFAEFLHREQEVSHWAVYCVIVGVLIRKISKVEEYKSSILLHWDLGMNFVCFIPPAWESSLNFDDLQLAY